MHERARDSSRLLQLPGAVRWGKMCAWPGAAVVWPSPHLFQIDSLKRDSDTQPGRAWVSLARTRVHGDRRHRHLRRLRSMTRTALDQRDDTLARLQTHTRRCLSAGREGAPFV
eukprot:365851-Chlamydomonas_euryale.AAC.1